RRAHRRRRRRAGKAEPDEFRRECSMNLAKNRAVLPIVALSIAALGFYHVQQMSHSAPLTAPPASPARVPLDHALAGARVVEAQSENIAVGAALSGLVLEVYMPSSSVGERVEAGQPLFRIDDRHLRAQLAVAEAQLGSAKVQLAKLQQQPRPEELPP